MILEKKKIVLLGMTGVGKTTIGRVLSKILRRTFVDIDIEVEKLLKLENEYMTLKTKITMGPPADAMEDLNTIYKHFLEMEKYEKKINEKIHPVFITVLAPKCVQK